MKPALFVTGLAPAYRRAPFEELAATEDVTFAFFGGAVRHGGASGDRGGLPGADVPQRHIYRMASGGAHRAVICGTAGRVALPAAYAGARAARVPFVMWASLWAHPRTAPHLLSYPLARHIYRSADAVVTYGRHVSEFVAARGARNVHVAPQCVDNGFWAAPTEADAVNEAAAAWGDAPYRVLFAGRQEPEKGLRVLVAAWQRQLSGTGAGLVLAGEATSTGAAPAATACSDIVAVGKLGPERLRNFYEAADVLVLPSVRTRDFREPWGLVINEAFNRALPVIASDEVGAVAGGFLRDGVNGLVVPAGDESALANAIARLRDPELRERLGRNGRKDVARLDAPAWARGFSAALQSVGASRGLT